MNTQKRSLFKIKQWLVASAALLVGASALAQANRNVETYNIKEAPVGVGLKGYDPVAVFPEGGGAPAKGRTEFRLDYLGVIYFFSSQRNLQLFSQNPQKYEPTYGGWCAFAMASGQYIDIQPQIYTLNGNRAHYFVARRAKINFDRDLESFETNADFHWKQISGEDPRR